MAGKTTLLQIGHEAPWNSRVHSYKTRKDAEAVMRRYVSLRRAAGDSPFHVTYDEKWRDAWLFRAPDTLSFDRIIRLRLLEVPERV